jgi:hypothetical protein
MGIPPFLKNIQLFSIWLSEFGPISKVNPSSWLTADTFSVFESGEG